MRTHYIPQKYLSRFAVKPESRAVCQYDRQLGTFKTLTVKAIGVFTDWFSPLTEDQLSKIEGAALTPMDKLADCRQQLDEAERKAVCAYIASMVQRVPPGRDSALSIMEVTYERFKNNPELVHEELGVPTSVVESYFARFELDGTRERIIEEDAKLILDLPQFENALEAMEWTILLATGGRRFITSDAPVYWDKSTGVGKSGAELTFPISTKAVLYLCKGESNCKIEYTHASERVHTELNRRAVHNSKRFIFSSTNDKWVKLLAQRRTEPNLRLAEVMKR